MSTASDTVKTAYNQALSVYTAAKSAYDNAQQTYLKMSSANVDQNSSGQLMNINQAGYKLLAKYTEQPGTTYNGSQYTVPYGDGYLISYPKGSDTVYEKMTSALKHESAMVVTNGGHGGSFGVDNDGNIWACTKAQSGGYQISKFAYQASTTISAYSQTALLKSTDIVHVNYDRTNNLVGFEKGYIYYVCEPIDLSTAKYSIDLTTVGLDPINQTFQCTGLSLPYVYWHVGQYSTSDPATVSCVNVETGIVQFSKVYDTSLFGMAYALSEPEGVYPDGDVLLVTFNNHNSSGNAINYLFSIPLINANSSLDQYLLALNATKKALAEAAKAYNLAKAAKAKYDTGGTATAKATKAEKKAQTAYKNQANIIANQRVELQILKKKEAVAKGSAKTRLQAQITRVQATISKSKAKEAKLKTALYKAKTSLSRAQATALTNAKAAARTILRQAVSANIDDALAALGGNDDVVITPVNPGSADSFVVISADNISSEVSSTVNSNPIIKGQPISTITAPGAPQITVTGHIMGEPGSEASLRKRWEKLFRWSRDLIEVEYSSATGSNTHCLIETTTQDQDKNYDNAIPVTATINYVNWSDSNANKKKKTTTKKATKTGGSGRKKTTAKYVTTKSGDTYYKMSLKYRSTVAQLRKWNGWSDTKIPIGKKMRVK